MTVPSVTSGCEFYDGGANSNPTYAILKAVMPMVPLPEVVIAVERKRRSRKPRRTKRSSRKRRTKRSSTKRRTRKSRSKRR